MIRTHKGSRPPASVPVGYAWTEIREGLWKLKPIAKENIGSSRHGAEEKPLLFREANSSAG